MPPVPANQPTSLKVSLLTSVIVPRDAISNVTLQQADAFTRYARERGIHLDLKIYTAASDVHDTRIAIAPDLAGVVTDEHFLASDVIVYQFGIVYPLFESIHLTPASAKVAVCYYGITPPSIMPESARDVLQQSYRQLTNVLAADQIITTSSFLVDELTRIGVPQDNILRLPLSSGFCDGSPIPEKSPSETIRLMYVGRFVQAKGVIDLLRAAVALAKNSKTSFTLDLVGSQRFSDATYLQRLTDLVRDAKLEDRIRFAFDVSDQDLRERLRTVDALIIPSYHEGFCMPVIEAMACGCFVICSDAGALPETAGGLGSVYPTGNVDALQKRLEEFAAAYQTGQMPTDAGPLPLAAWRTRAQQYLAAFSHKAFRDNLCNTLFGSLRRSDEEARKSLTRARRSMLIDFRQSPIHVPQCRFLETQIIEALNAARGIPSDQPAPAAPAPTPEPPTPEAAAPAIRIDYAAALRGLWAKPDDQFVFGLYTLLLNRPAGTDELALHVPTLQQGLSRAELLQRFAESDEAKNRGLDTSWLSEFTTSPAPATTPAAQNGPAVDVPAEITRQKLRDVPVIGKAARYAKRSLLLPWNFQKLFDSIPAVAADQNRAYADQQATFHLLLRLQGDILAEMRQTNSAVRADLQHLKVSPPPAPPAAPVAPAADHLDEIQATVNSAKTELIEEIKHSVGEATIGLSNWLNLLTRKEEMLAMDLRERIPPMPDRQFPEPLIVDPAAYESKIQAAGDHVKVNLGSGEKPLSEYINVDFRRLPETDIVADIRKLPFAPASLAEIASSHLVEHFRQHHLATVILPYWKSLLQPGGTLRTICPNWQAMLQRVQSGQMSFADFKVVTFGLQDYSGDDHFAMYSPETLSDVLKQAGFHDIQIVTESRLNGICPEMEITARA